MREAFAKDHNYDLAAMVATLRRHQRESGREVVSFAPRRLSTGALRPVEDLTGCTLVHTMPAVEFEWDEEKAAANLRKHGVDFADAALVLEDDLALSMADQFSEGEQRFVALGVEPGGRLLVVVYTWRGERIRLISARPASGMERRNYEKRR